jgi:hypothetical protein
MNKIFTFGDGYATGHIWPEWPQILAALLPNYEIINTAGIGAGNEFILNAVLAQAESDPDGIFIVQWGWPHRFDKLLENLQWDSIIQSDQIYNKNIVELAGNKWWLSSRSISEDIVRYHNFYIESKQSDLRTRNYMLLLKNYFENRQIKHFFMLGSAPKHQNDELYSRQWVWHEPWKGMFEFSMESRFKEIRQNQVQPSPPVHLAWVEDILLPKLGINVDIERIKALNEAIHTVKWIPYYYDRDQLWLNLLASID